MDVFGAVTVGISDEVFSALLIVLGGGGVEVYGGGGGEDDDADIDEAVGGLGCRRTSLRLGNGGGTACLTGRLWAGECDARTGCVGGGGSRLFSPDARDGGGGGVGRGEGEGEAEAKCAGFFPPSPSLLLQLAALSPSALAIFQRPRLLGGTGGFSPFAATGVIVGGATKLGNSSSQTFSTMPVRTNAHNVHVLRRRVRHHPLVHSGYMVDDWDCVEFK